MSDNAPEINWLKRHHLRVTKHRIAILRALFESEQPITLAEIRDKIKATGCDFTTVFRFIEALEAKGLITPHPWDDRTPRYKLHSAGNHQHYLICRSCHSVREINACAVHQLEKQLSEQWGFTNLSHSLEFYGICPNCPSSKNPNSHKSHS